LSDLGTLLLSLYQSSYVNFLDQPWTHKEPVKLNNEDVVERKLQGIAPTIPEQYLNTTKKELQALYVATTACYQSDPQRRPTVRFEKCSLKESMRRILVS
jgi:hypothetical protein